MSLLILFFGCLFNLTTFANAQILTLGDSQSSGPFGEQLYVELKNFNLSVDSYSARGTVLRSWIIPSTKKVADFRHIRNINPDFSLKSSPLPSLRSLLEAHKPTWVILEFGGNYRGEVCSIIREKNKPVRVVMKSEALINQGLVRIKGDVQNAINLIRSANAKCIFVSSPGSAPHYETPMKDYVIPAIREQIQDQCLFYNSLNSTRYPENYNTHNPQGDGLHYVFSKEARDQARAWATDVVATFRIDLLSALKDQGSD